MEIRVSLDSKMSDTQNIQAAIDICAQAGGGRVVIPGGKIYSIGTLFLRSHMELHLETGCVLKSSKNPNDFTLLTAQQGDAFILQTLPSYQCSDYGGQPPTAMLYGKHLEDIQLTGFGCIDGNEEYYHAKETPYHIEGKGYPRPPMILLEDVHHLTIRQVTLQNNAFWTLHMVGCSDVEIDGIRILNNLKMANCDGIDPDHCQNVRISNCFIRGGDDAIVIKNTKAFAHYGNTSNILVHGCVLQSTSAALKIGTEGETDFENILVSNCQILSSNRGISIQIRDKGNVRHVRMQNIQMETRLFSHEWWGRAEPISISSINRNENTLSGTIDDVTVQNIDAQSENGILIYADKAGKINHIRLKDVRLRLQKTTKWPVVGYDYRPGLIQNKECSLVYGLHVYNAELETDELHVEVDPTMQSSFAGEKNLGVCNP